MSGERPGALALPVGTVTLLLTDVEGSTAQWQVDADAMGAAIARHYELLTAVVEAHGGVRPLEQGEGDSMVAAFTRATDAVAAAADAQRRIHAEPWPTTSPLRVRMAVHTGDAEVRDEAYYAGNTIIRTARLRDLAYGGQVLISGAARDLAVDELDAEVELVDLGSHRLKDLARSERVWQLALPGLPGEFPPLRSLDAVPNNLPVALSSFIGRFDEIDIVTKLVLGNRLVTLAGSGGAGKTRLAQQVAAELLEAFPDGVWWIDLVGVTDGALVASAVSRAMLLPEDRDDRVAGVVRRIAGERSLLVLDNCEHVSDACAELATAVLTGCGEVTLLTTSRTPLNLPGELTWRLPPVSITDATRLFADRATRVQQDLHFDAEAMSVVAEICERLDGIPLAIELAAARCRVLTPSQIRDGLTDAIGLLSRSPRGVQPHHETIEASIRWSHSLLPSAEQVLFRRLGVFASPFSLEGARAVAVDDAADEAGVLSGLELLVEHSLVQMDDRRGVERFRMLETVRQFAQRELDAASESAQLAERHARHFETRALALWPLFHTGMSDVLADADVEFEDLIALFAYQEVNATPEQHAAVAMAALPAMSVRHLAEASLLADRAVARVDDMSVLGGRLRLRMVVVDTGNPEHVGRGVAAAEAFDDPEIAAQAAYWATWAETVAAPTPDAVSRYRAALAHLETVGETHFSKTYWSVAALERSVGRHDHATRQAALAKTETQCKRCNVMAWSESALLALSQGDLASAEAALARALAFAVEVRDTGFMAHVRLTQTELAAYAGRAWPVAEVDAELVSSATTVNPLVLGYLSEARALGQLVDGTLADDSGFTAGIELLDDRFAKRTEARLRQATFRHAGGDLDGARALTRELRDLADRWQAGPWLYAQLDHRAAALALDGEDLGAADDLAHTSLQMAATGPWPPLVVSPLELLSSIAEARESYVEAGRLVGAAARLRDEIGFRYDVEPERGRLSRSVDAASEALGAAEFERAMEDGRGLTIAEAVAYAQRARGERKRPSHGWDGLTPTERQVADLAIGGLSNAQIAERLFIGGETVKTHLSSVYAKVGVANRTQLAADAAKRGIGS